MKSDPLTGTLVGVLCVSVLASIYYFYAYVSKTHEFRQVQAQFTFIQQREPYVRQMIGEVLEYSKTHPAIEPLLENVGLKPKANAPAQPARK
jgi:hypothetical protein